MFKYKRYVFNKLRKLLLINDGNLYEVDFEDDRCYNIYRLKLISRHVKSIGNFRYDRIYI